jgi:hypothetical protein
MHDLHFVVEASRGITRSTVSLIVMVTRVVSDSAPINSAMKSADPEILRFRSWWRPPEYWVTSLVRNALSGSCRSTSIFILDRPVMWIKEFDPT